MEDDENGGMENQPTIANQNQTEAGIDDTIFFEIYLFDGKTGDDLGLEKPIDANASENGREAEHRNDATRSNGEEENGDARTGGQLKNAICNAEEHLFKLKHNFRTALSLLNLKPL